MPEIGCQQFDSFGRRRRIWKHTGIGTNANETGLCQRTGCPPTLPMPPEPAHGSIVLLMIRPQKGYQNVDIQQENIHGKSLKASFT